MGDTMSFERMIRILRMLEWLKERGQTEYWRWLSANILKPLAESFRLSEKAITTTTSAAATSAPLAP
ncbi:hypothetical protein AJ79_10329 [Helicocarpus griseus UAMH5409]|uniref:Uncharacterized protein n=1 Tax=Helicocarpus griseus UAMH5409 TaxID=1447875 RepID=A0A2B7WEG8_9EURO|nr:hypothetical protein AJ79_10329 [Helicocarpus griseus UAMH5409]